MSVIDKKVESADKVFRMIREVGLPLFQAVFLLCVIVAFGYWLLCESKADKEAYRELADKMAEVIKSNTEASMGVSMAVKSLEKEIQRE